MGARAILTEIRDLLQAQIDAVVAGDHQQVLAGALRHEELLRDLDGAELDATPAEIKALVDEIQTVKSKLQSLLTTESARVDFLLRLILGGGPPKPGGYPASAAKQAGRLNRRT
jgi:hypothetical protein